MQKTHTSNNGLCGEPGPLLRSYVMPEMIVASPLRHSAVTRPYSFSNGITIQEISPILWDISAVNKLISAHEREDLESTRYWLCARGDVEHVHSNAADNLCSEAMHAMSALQIICPSGAKNVFLKLIHSDKGYDNVGSLHPKELCNTLLGRFTKVEDRGLARDFDPVYLMVKRAFAEKLVRLQNPVLLLEHGMQIGNINLGALMFSIGLDMLVMAGEKMPFVARLGGFLGPQSFVFPPDSIMQLQPLVKVQDVLADLYEFRNSIAHGREIPKVPYRQKYDLLCDGGGRINQGDYYYSELMVESGLFLLTEALRKIAVDNLFGVVQDEEKWRLNLRLYEHRWKDKATATLENKSRKKL